MQRHLGFLIAGAVGALLVAGAVGALAPVRSASAAGAATPSACAQWELTLGPAVTSKTATTTTAGSFAIESAPAGWEPFAYMPSGQLSYRRCAK
jgi:hypothetical protein